MLDTISTLHDGRYVYDENTRDRGHFLQRIPYPTNGTGRAYYGNENYDFDPAEAMAEGNEDTGQGFEVVLRRRLNPNLPLAPLNVNPWVEVDRIRVEFRDLFNFTPAGMSYTADAEFPQLISEERPEPLDAANVSVAHPAANNIGDDYRYNTIAPATNPQGGINDSTTTMPGGVFSIWQPHFDRDFTSVIELFHLPIIGPRLLTQRLERMRHSPPQQASEDVTVVDIPGNPDLISSAVGMFLQPDVLPVGNDVNDNAWYRLLQFVEVPSKVNAMLGEYLSRHRVPGKIDINNLKHIEVYAGLIDDPLIADVPILRAPGTGGALDANNQYAPFMFSSASPIPMDATAGPRPANQTGAGATGPTSVQGVTLPSYRDRWFEFIAERDGATTGVYDPVTMQPTTFWIPGSLNSRPFRSTGYRTSEAQTAAGSTGSDTLLDETILRRLSQDESDAAPTTNRHWLEMGSQTNHNDPTSAADTVTQRERHQVMARVYNNSTTVSNTFIIYGTAAYFQAAEDPSGHIRVGSRMGLDLDNDGNETNDAGWERRAVFVIDRTELLNAFDEGTGNFDWQRLVKYRADLPSDEQ